MRPPPQFLMPCEEGTSSKNPLDRSSGLGTLLTKIKAARGRESQLPRHCAVGLFAALPILLECRFTTCRRREKKSKASVELWERTPKRCWARARLRADSRKNR